MSENNLNSLEAAVIELLLRGSHRALMVLREQLTNSYVVNRELTGAGFSQSLRWTDHLLQHPWRRRLFGFAT